VSELADRLEARGLALQEVTVRMPDQPEFRWEPPAPPPTALSESPSPSSYRQGESDRGRRDRASSEEASEEDR